MIISEIDGSVEGKMAMFSMSIGADKRIKIKTRLTITGIFTEKCKCNSLSRNLIKSAIIADPIKIIAVVAGPSIKLQEINIDGTIIELTFKPTIILKIAIINAMQGIINSR